MASIIRIKRSSTAGDPSTLGAGELAYSSLLGTQSNGGDRLYIGFGTETAGNAVNHFVIGGKYFTDMMDHQHGVLTADSALIVDADKKIDELNVDNITLNGNTISSTNTNGNLLIDPAGSGYVQIVGINGLVIPSGTAAQQGPAVDGTIRLNTDSGQFEGYANGNWASLGGVRSVDGLTYISAELTPGVSDDTLRFYTNGVLNMYLDTGELRTGTAIQVKIDNQTESTSSSTGALVVDGGVGIAGNLNVAGNFEIAGDTIYTGDIAVQGGDLYSTASTFNLLNKDSSASVTNDGPTTVNAFLGATSINIGAATGTTTINNAVDAASLTVQGSTLLKGTTTVGASDGRVATTVYGTTVDITGSSTTTIGVDASTGSAVAFNLQATNSVGDANLIVTADNSFTLDATAISIDSTDSSNLSMTANSSSTKTLTIGASNAGTGAAVIAIGSNATDDITITSSGTATLTTGALDLNATSATVDVNTFAVTATGAGNSGTVTTDNLTLNADTITIQGTEGSGDVTTLNIAGQVNIDNVRIEGNTIYTTDASNVMYLDPAPTNDNGGKVIIKGDLQVDGTTTTVNSTQVTIDDPVFTLGGDTAPTLNDSLDRGIDFRWHDGTSAKLGFFGYDESAAEFTFIADSQITAGAYDPTVAGVYGNLRFSKLALVDTTNSTTTNTGALTVAGGVGIGGQLNVAGSVNKFTSTQAATSTTTGAVVIAGGVGIGGSIFVGTNLIGAGPSNSTLSGFDIDGGTY